MTKKWYFPSLQAYPLADPRGKGSARDMRPPLSPISFLFMQFSEKKLPNKRLAQPSFGESGSATVNLHLRQFNAQKGKIKETKCDMLLTTGLFCLQENKTSIVTILSG